MGRRLNQLCPPYAPPSSNSSLDYRRSDARIVEDGFATSGGVSKSAKVVLVIWNASSSHYKRALGTPKEESAHGECWYERPTDRGFGVECAGTIIFGEA